jgi:hypothetical protein
VKDYHATLQKELDAEFQKPPSPRLDAALGEKPPAR